VSNPLLFFLFFVVVVVVVACVGSLTDFVTVAKRERSLIVGIDDDMILDEWDIYTVYTHCMKM